MNLIDDDSLGDRRYLNDPLWERIVDFQVDDETASLPFSARLARENRWSRYYASRVIGEYKRFCYLAMRAGHGVTPSEEVDQAWHLHLLYTRSYWSGFCAGVLGRPLHHGPTRGGVEEDTKFRDWYAKTLSSYRRLFGVLPPVDIWPATERRFAAGQSVCRIDTRQYWIVPKPGRWSVRSRWHGTSPAVDEHDLDR